VDQDKCRFYAEMINAYRVIPRIILVVYFTFFIYAWYFVVDWFIVFDWNSLPKDQIVGSVAAAAVAGFPAVILGLLTKVLKDLVESYWNPKDGSK
jgi:zona occludens toxin (predicted ATPase)